MIKNPGYISCSTIKYLVLNKKSLLHDRWMHQFFCYSQFMLIYDTTEAFRRSRSDGLWVLSIPVGTLSKCITQHECKTNFINLYILLLFLFNIMLVNYMLLNNWSNNPCYHVTEFEIRFLMPTV